MAGETFDTQPRVLVVDDEPMNIFVLQTMLSELGITSDSATGGSEALKLVQMRADMLLAGEAVQPYEVILMDFCMPDMDGPTTAREIQALLSSSAYSGSPDTAGKLPFICCCTAYETKKF